MNFLLTEANLKTIDSIKDNTIRPAPLECHGDYRGAQTPGTRRGSVRLESLHIARDASEETFVNDHLPPFDRRIIPWKEIIESQTKHDKQSISHPDIKEQIIDLVNALIAKGFYPGDLPRLSNGSDISLVVPHKEPVANDEQTPLYCLVDNEKAFWIGMVENNAIRSSVKVLHLKDETDSLVDRVAPLLANMCKPIHGRVEPII